MRTPQAIDEIDPLPGHAIEMDRSRKALGILSAMWREEYDVPGPALRIVGELAVKCAAYDKKLTGADHHPTLWAPPAPKLADFKLSGPADTVAEVIADLAGSEAGWIKWGGGECPVARGTHVDVRMRDGSEYRRQICELGWDRTGHTDIVAYRPSSGQIVVMHEDGRAWWAIPRNGDFEWVAPCNPAEPTRDGWIGWHGGECPVAPKTRVQVRNNGAYKERPSTPEPAAWWEWKSEHRITAYRVAMS